MPKVFDIEEEFHVGPFVYQIVSQSSSKEEYAVRVITNLQDSTWIKQPESRYETLGGAKYAILMDMETRVSKHIKL